MSEPAAKESATVQATVIVDVTIRIHFAQPFGPEWQLSEVHKRARSDAEDKARAWAADCNVGRAQVLKIDPDLSIQMRVKKP